MLIKKLVKKITKSIRNKLSRFISRYKVNRRSFIDRTVYVLGWKYIEVGSKSIIGEYSWLNINLKGGVIPRLKIGNFVYMGPYCVVSTGVKTVIGDYFLSGHNCRILGTNHVYDDPCKPYVSTGVYEDGLIDIEENVWMGTNAVIQGSVVIGRGSIIGASSVVTKDIPPFSICVGVPARVMKRYSFIRKEWVKVESWNSEDEASIISREVYLKELQKVKNINMPKRAGTRAYGDIF
jgi:acetyltransferase-like isoleucine patch superfamily enzyme